MRKQILKFRELIREWLGITANEYMIATLEKLLLHKKSKLNGFAVLKKHLNRSDKPLPRFAGKEIEQD